MTIDQIQLRLTQLETIVSDAVEEQHQICEELMTRAEPDQKEVDWSVVREAIYDTCDEDGLGSPTALQNSFQSHGLLVAHEPEPVPATPEQ